MLTQWLATSGYEGLLNRGKGFSGHIINKLYYVSPSYRYHHHPVNNSANFGVIKPVEINPKNPN
jgi:hypothetical protein